jgi:hypothetical protein
MSTFADRYCAQNNCPPRDFTRRVFWQTLHRHALPFAPLFMAGDYFESDRNLIEACSRATSMEQVRDEIHGHPLHAYHGPWLHRHAKLRVSTWRLRQLAALYLGKPRRAAGPGDPALH